MQPYGKQKRKHKIHPHNECAICSENNFNKKQERRRGKKEIVDEFSDRFDIRYFEIQ